MSLVEGETVTVDPEDSPGSPPSAVDIAEALDRPDIDSTDVVRLPEFLERD
jgi:HD-like signal output (HDOD) protein